MLTQSELQWLEDRKKRCYFCEYYKDNKCVHWKTWHGGESPLSVETNKCRCFTDRHDRSDYFWNYERFIGRVIENLARQTPNPFEALKKAYIEAEEQQR